MKFRLNIASWFLLLSSTLIPSHHGNTASQSTHSTPAQSFAKQHPKAQENEFHFVVLGDSQFHDTAKFNRIIDQTTLLMPSFVIQVGDLIQGYNNDADAVEKEWSRFKNQINPLLPIPFLPVPGNHDVYNANRKVDEALERLYENHWGNLYKSFHYKNAHFFLINTDSVEAQNTVGPKQMAWLNQELKTSNSTHKFAFMHKPALLLKNTEALHKIFLEHGVSHVFYGHHHHYHYVEKDGIHYSMTNAAANMVHDQAQAGGFHQLLQVSVSGPKVSVAVITADSIQPKEAVSAIDNYDLFVINRNLTRKKTTLEQIKGPNFYQISLKLDNKAKRDITLNISCRSKDNRWHFDPQKIAPIRLESNTSHLLKIKTHFELDRKPESLPECTVKIPFQTQDGQWLDLNQTIKTVKSP